jgi:MoxR-like ATPase
VANREPSDVAALADWFDAEVLALPPAAAPWLERAVQAFDRQLQVEQSMPAEGGDDAAGKLALARAIGLGDGDGGASMGAQRIVSQRLEEALRRRFSPLHVTARVAQVAELQAQVDEARARLGERSLALADAMSRRLWLAPPLAARTASAFRAALATLDDLALRLHACRTGFAELPVDGAAAGEVPPAPPQALAA